MAYLPAFMLVLSIAFVAIAYCCVKDNRGYTD